MSAKVTIEITAEGWTKTVEVGGETHIERWKRTWNGAKSTEGNFEDDPGIKDKLYEALQTMSFLDISIALKR